MRNKIFITLHRLLFVGLLSAVSAVLIGCTKGELNKDEIFARNLELIGRTLQSGQSAEVFLPVLNKNELIVMINGSYSGTIEASTYLSKQLATQITLEYATKVGNNYILLIRDQKIQSVTALNENNVEVFSTTLKSNAKVARFGMRNANLQCIVRSSKPSVEVWNSQCRLNVMEFK